MDELISRLTAASGVDAATAQTALGIVLRFLNKEAPPDAMSQLVSAIPGADALIAGASDSGGGIMGALTGLMGGGGGVMALGGQLMGAGMGMGQIQSFSKELFAYGRETAGEDVMGQIVSAVPGLAQFV